MLSGSHNAKIDFCIRKKCFVCDDEKQVTQSKYFFSLQTFNKRKNLIQVSDPVCTLRKMEEIENLIDHDIDVSDHQYLGAAPFVLFLCLLKVIRLHP